jgi:hypothetical protein
MPKTIAAAIVVAFMPVAAASAQARLPSPLFVEGAVLADFDAGSNGALRGAGATVGVFLTPRYSLRFDFETAGWHVSNSGGTGRVGDRLDTLSRRQATRTVTYAGLFGTDFHPGAHAQLTLLAGVTGMSAGIEESVSLDSRTTDGALIGHIALNQQSTDLWPALTTGVDVALPVSRHLAAVGEVRVHVLPIGDPPLFITRPRIGLRWRF